VPIISGGGGGGAAPLTWTNVTGGVGFTNGWAEYANGYGAVGYALSGNLVYLRGVADASAATGDGIFTLPVALRPSVKRIFLTFGSGGAGNAGAFEVLTTGVVSGFQKAGISAFSLDGCVVSL